MASLPDGEWYLMRPVNAGMCRYESLGDGTLRLSDVARMNDTLDVLEHNNAVLKGDDR